MDKNSYYQWLAWLSQVLRHLRNGNLQRVANYLACSLPEDYFEKVDHVGARRMFTHAELVPYRTQLWAMMFPLIVPDCLSLVRQLLENYGWNIPMTDDERMWMGFHQVRTAFGYDGLYYISMEHSAGNVSFIDIAGQTLAIAKRNGDKIALYVYGSRFGIVGRMFYIADDGSVTNIDGQPLQKQLAQAV